MSEGTIAALAVSVGLVAQIILQVMAKIEANKVAKHQKDAADKAAAKVAEVKKDLEATNHATDRKLAELAEVALDTHDTGEKVHMLVNSAMTTQLKVVAVALRRLATMTKNQDDIEAANLAEQVLRVHEEKQKLVDSVAGAK